ncbi:MAG: GNAT family N-acetyltransferase [Paludibacteraceae bacterium]
MTQKMYEVYLEAENLFLVAENQNEIVGFCMGHMYGTKAMDIFYKNNAGTLIKRTLMLLMQGHPLVWKKVRGIVKSEWQKIKRRITKAPEPEITYLTDDIHTPTASLLSICVLSVCRGKGVSVALFQAYEQLLRTRGVKAFTLATWAGNTRGIAFYYKMGMRLRQT